MAIQNPFRISVYDKQMRYITPLNNPESCSFTPRFNAQGSGSIYLRDTDPVLQAVLEPGARLGVEYRGEHLMSGPVRSPSGPLISRRGQVTLQLQDDWRRLVNTYAWVNPAGPLAPATLSALAQATQVGALGGPGTIDGQGGYYQWPASATTIEAAIKAIVQANLSRLPYTPLDIRPDLGRGGNPRSPMVLPDVRFLRLSEAIAPLLTASGLGARVWQPYKEQAYAVDVFEPVSWVKPITAEAGIVTEGSWSLRSPDATRSVVGGPGEMAARAFWDGGISADVEAEYHDVIETFTDATGATLSWPDEFADALEVAKYYLLRPEIDAGSKATFTRYLDAAGTKARTEGAPSAGVAIQLSETEAFHFAGPTGFHLGDALTVESGDLTFSDRITECTLSLNASTGLTVSPVVGEKKDDPDRQVARAIVSLATALRTAKSSR